MRGLPAVIHFQEVSQYNPSIVSLLTYSHGSVPKAFGEVSTDQSLRHHEALDY